MVTSSDFNFRLLCSVFLPTDCYSCATSAACIWAQLNLRDFHNHARLDAELSPGFQLLLGDRIETRLLVVRQDGLRDCQRRDRRGHLLEANLRLEVARLTEKMDEMGRMIGPRRHPDERRQELT